MREHEDVEDYGLHNRVVRRRILKTENLQPKKVDDEYDGDLIGRLQKDLLVHVDGEQRCGELVWLSIEKNRRRRIGSKREGSERVHDDVDPEQLDGRQGRCLRRRYDGCDRRNDDGGHVGGELELQEFPDCVIDTAPPHDSFDNGGKIVIHKDDIGSIFCYLGTSDAHRKADVRSFEGRSVIGTVTSDGDDLPQGAQLFNENFLVFRGGTCKNLESRHDVEHFCIV